MKVIFLRVAFFLPCTHCHLFRGAKKDAEVGCSSHLKGASAFLLVWLDQDHLLDWRVVPSLNHHPDITRIIWCCHWVPWTSTGTGAQGRERESEHWVKEQSEGKWRNRYHVVNSNSYTLAPSSTWDLKFLTKRKAERPSFDPLIIIPLGGGASSLGFVTTFLVSFFTAFLVTKKYDVRRK